MEQTTGFVAMGDRYRFDFKLCRSSEGWAQLDTMQDAWYYGNWVNPLTLELVSYCEGDLTHTKCADESEFKLKLLDALGWHKEHGYDPKIDPMCRPEIEAALKRLGFEEWLH